MLFIPYGGLVGNGSGPGSTTTIGGTGTTIKKFQSYITNAQGTLISNPYPGQTAVTDLVIPVNSDVSPGQNVANGKIGGRRFKVYVSGSVYVAGTSPTLNFELIANLGNTIGTDVDMATLASASSLTTSTSYDFSFSAELYGNAAPTSSGLIGGSGNLGIANCTFFLSGAATPVIPATSITQTALTGVKFNGQYGTNYPTSAYNAQTYPAFFFKFGLIFGVSNSANLASLTEFYVTDDQ